MNQRNNIIDIAKGIGIFLVVFTHVCEISYIHTINYSFHMPLFFIIAGFFIEKSINKYDKLKEYVKDKAKRLLFPYLVFSIIFFVYWLLIERKIRNGNENVLYNFLNIFLCFINKEWYAYDIVMWFLPCLFTTEVIYYLVDKYAKTKKTIVCVILFIFGIIFSKFKIIFPFAIESALICCLFIDVGDIFNRKKVLYKEKYKSILILLISLTIFIISVKNNGNISILSHSYKNIIFFLGESISGSLIVLILSKYINTLFSKLNLVLSNLGKNSMNIMIIHDPIKRVGLKLTSIILSINIYSIRGNIFLSIIMSIIILLVAYFISILIDKVFAKNLKENKE